MPSAIDQLRITAQDEERLDRRVKLTKSEKETIRRAYFAMHKSERPTHQALADLYHVSRRLISFILYPERIQKHKERTKRRNTNRINYNAEKRRQYMQGHRDYKRSLVAQGKLKTP